MQEQCTVAHQSFWCTYVPTYCVVSLTASACTSLSLSADIDIQVVGLIRMLIDPDLHLRPDLGGDKAQVAVSWAPVHPTRLASRLCLSRHLNSLLV